MGFMDNVRVIQGHEANKLSKKQLDELRKTPPPPNNYAPPRRELPVKGETTADIAGELRKLNESADSIASSLAALVLILGPHTPPVDQA